MEFAPTLPPGDQPTRERVVRSILVGGPSTAADLAVRLDLTPAAVRRHLDHLLAEGALEARQPRPSAARGRGRPAKVFAITEAGREHFDQQYDDLAVQALRYLSETGGDDAVMEFARRRVAFIERDYDAVTAAHPDLTPGRGTGPGLLERGVRRIRAVTAAGRCRGDGAPEQLCQQHCPVSHVAHEFPQLCEAETEAIGHVLGRHVQRFATIAHGDGVCTTCIPHSTATTVAVSTGSTNERTS